MVLKCIEADWPAPVVAGTTLRQGGVSDGPYASLNLGDHVDDDPQHVGENRRRFVAECRLPSEPRWLQQVHSARVEIERPVSEADALVSREPGAVCVVLTADCLPVLFASADGSEVAAAHAGWRGLCAGVLENVVSALRTDPGELVAWLGPAISQPAFEVGTEVRDQFVGRDPAAAACFEANERGRFQADLYALARLRLLGAGLSRIYGGDRCTYRESDAFFSYRRDGQCGRMASFVYLPGHA